MKSLLLFALAFVSACGRTSAEKTVDARVVDVLALDYAFETPTELPPGRTLFRFENKGKVRHEFNIFLLKKGVSIDRFLTAQRAGETIRPFIDGPLGVLFAQPGEKPASGLVSDLLPGREYGIICIFRDSANAPPHHDLGMYSVIKVASTTAPSVAVAETVDSVTATDYAFRYPRSVQPGKHVFLFRNEGKVRHEFSVSLLKKGVTLEKSLEVEKAGGDVEALIDQELGLLHARAGEAPLARLEIDMLPGREYAIVCFFQDTEKSKPHYELGMFGSITVAGEPAA